MVIVFEKIFCLPSSENLPLIEKEVGEVLRAENCRVTLLVFSHGLFGLLFFVKISPAYLGKSVSALPVPSFRITL